MASKKLRIEHGNNEDDSNRSNSSNALHPSSSGEKMKEDMDISPLDGDMLDIISKKLLSFDDLFNFSACDGKLLVVRFVPNAVLYVYRIDFATMSYVKLQSLGDLALFFSPYKCYALANPGEWGYESNRVYSIKWPSAQCKVYSGSNNELMECIELAGNREVLSRSRPYWRDWCFRNEHYEVDYSLVE
ncbi:hypothetical protein P8452_60138 [Trifolium repens]|nr:hypothetical protein P8452_60138 [Trifolium repens]